MNQIDQIVKSITAAKDAIKSAAAAAAEAAPKGQKMPYRQHAQFEAASAVASAAADEIAKLGYKPANVCFAKPRKDGTRRVTVSYDIPVTLESRLAKHAEATERRKAAIEARKAAKGTKPAGKPAPTPAADVIEMSAADRLTAALRGIGTAKAA